jgi:hypothetical protein
VAVSLVAIELLTDAVVVAVGVAGEVATDRCKKQQQK